MADRGGAAQTVRRYLDRVVNARDLGAVDEMVAASYVGSGHGWPADRGALRAFYEWQASTRPDWRIDVQDIIEVDGCVVVRAYAGGTISDDEGGRPLAAPANRQVEWLAVYRLVDGSITEIEILALRARD
jgi:hypothetical protein